MQITPKTDAQTEARAIAPLTLEGAIWHYMDQKAVAAYGPWITKADHDAALAAKDAELEAVRANRTDAHGWLFNNPDTGIEWLEQHPIESGEVPDAENVRPASSEEVVTLLREAWNALAVERAAREAAEAKLTERVKVKPLARAPKEQAAIGWTLQVDMLYDVARKVADDGWGSPTIEVVEIVMIEAERRILSALEATPPASEGRQDDEPRAEPCSRPMEVSAMRELPRDLVTILRTEARNQRTPPIDYIIAGDGGRAVRQPDPDIAMAELLEEAAARLAEALEALEPFASVALLDQTPDAPRGMWVSVPFGWLQDARRVREGGKVDG